MAGNHKEWIEHGEYHPNIDHLNVTCPWDRLRDSHESQKKKVEVNVGNLLNRSMIKITARESFNMR